MHKTIGIGIVYFITCVFGLLWQAGQVAVFLWQTLFVQRPKHSNVEDLHTDYEDAVCASCHGAMELQYLGPESLGEAVDHGSG
jgi:hypothetical protein